MTSPEAVHTFTLTESQRKLVAGLLAEHVINLGRAIRRPDLTPEGAARYSAEMLAAAQAGEIFSRRQRVAA